jgi:hypothetical protein
MKTQKTEALSQDEINHLLRLINGKPGPKSQRTQKAEVPSHSGDDGALTQDEINQLLGVIPDTPDPQGQRARGTEVLTQDEIDQLLRAITADDDDE